MQVEEQIILIEEEIIHLQEVHRKSTTTTAPPNLGTMNLPTPPPTAQGKFIIY